MFREFFFFSSEAPDGDTIPASVTLNRNSVASVQPHGERPVVEMDGPQPICRVTLHGDPRPLMVVVSPLDMSAWLRSR
jgi:hypothetical protein